MKKLVFLPLILLMSCYSSMCINNTADICKWHIGDFTKYGNQLTWKDKGNTHTLYIQLNSYSGDRTWFNYMGDSIVIGKHYAIGFHIFVDFKSKEVNVFDWEYKNEIK